jgi:hypothetical protein
MFMRLYRPKPEALDGTWKQQPLRAKWAERKAKETPLILPA